ncbi:hypothetical protein MA16_Dca020763 [Dendrobium catenatum]|uniref:DUF4283 domain-containing protein n=1 Tax=Dendrobium catenatum TaxID=906689 RepID=A0A2I0WDM0_9ASPA|nr:hypothetical protein MA16_Dca020763 [Dendrobium catenatum]
MGWFLCSLIYQVTLDEVLSGGPWFMNDHIIGMERWSMEFSPSSMKGLTAPIWIRMPHLPLQCWDEINVARIASLVGKPLMLDGNMFKWGDKRFCKSLCSSETRSTHAIRSLGGELG